MASIDYQLVYYNLLHRCCCPSGKHEINRSDLFRIFWLLLLFCLLFLPLLLLVLTLALGLSLVLRAAALRGTDRTPGGPLWRLEVDPRVSRPIRVLTRRVTVGCDSEFSDLTD